MNWSTRMAGRVIRRRRVMLGMSLRELAQSTGLSDCRIAEIEREVGAPQCDTEAARLALVLGEAT